MIIYDVLKYLLVLNVQVALASLDIPRDKIYEQYFLLVVHFCLRNFGQVLGNCVSDKAYLKFITKQPKPVRNKF